jgi:hypothetical protein
MVIPCKVWDGLSELQAWEAGMVEAIVAFLFILAPSATPTRPLQAQPRRFDRAMSHHNR